MTDIAALRENYTKGSLEVSDVSLSPFDQFQKWFDEAVSSQLLEPNALLLSTVSNDGKPSSRIVLLKGIDAGFKFFTMIKSLADEIVCRCDSESSKLWHIC